jgi:hypothetical protein
MPFYDQLHELLNPVKWVVLLVALPLLFIYGRVLLGALLGRPAPGAKTASIVGGKPVAPVRRSPIGGPRPGGAKTPTPIPPGGKQEVLPSSLEAGIAGHAQRAAAKTAKIPTPPARANESQAPTDIIPPAVPRGATPPPTARIDKPLAPPEPNTIGSNANDDAALADLFGGVAKVETPAAPELTEGELIRRKATRMEELGFHHGIASDTLTGAPGAIAPTGDTSKPADPPRSQTAELTSILERIDKFLAEDQPAPGAEKVADKSTDKVEAKPATTTITPKPAVEAPAASAPPENPATKKTQPLWARADVQDEDLEKKDPPKDPGTSPEQQRLF